MNTTVDSKWTYALTDYQGNVWGPVMRAKQRTFTHPLNGMRTASFAIDIDNPATKFLFNPPTLNGLPLYPLLKVYRENRLGVNQLVMVGDVVSMKVANRTLEGMGQVTVVAADGLWRLAKRLIGMGTDTRGRGQGYTYASAQAQQPISKIIDDVLNDTNTISGASGILRGSVPLNTANGAVDPAVYQQVVSTLIAQLSALVGGPDYEITPHEPTTAGTAPVATIGTLNQFFPLGSTKTNVMFEYGCGQKNVNAYSVDWDRTGQITKAWSLPQGFPTAVAAGDNTVIYEDNAAAAVYGVWEDSIPSDVTSIPLRQQLCKDFVNIRRYARNQITFTPANNCNQDYGADYLPGDVVMAAAIDQDVLIYDGSVRVYGCSFTVSDEEVESNALTLIPS